MSDLAFHRSIVRRLAVLVPSLLLAWPSGRATAETPGKEEISWATSFETALEEAQIEGRLVMVDFYTSWCGWCRRLDADTYSNHEVIQRSRKMVCVKVDAEARKDVASRYAVRAFPTITFLQPDGTLIDAVRGYKTPDKFTPLLDQYLDSRGQEFTLTQRLRDHPELDDVRQDLAHLYMRNGNAEGALAQLDTLARSASRLPESRVWEVRLDRGRALLTAGRTEEAAREFEAFAKKQKKSPRYAEALYFLGEAKLAQGKSKDARKWFRKLLDVRSTGWLAERSRTRLDELG
jgi:thioredoxin-like negative regulator of GroEL